MRAVKVLKAGLISGVALIARKPIISEIHVCESIVCIYQISKRPRILRSLTDPFFYVTIGYITCDVANGPSYRLFSNSVV
jgi:hypothetical protein